MGNRKYRVNLLLTVMYDFAVHFSPESLENIQLSFSLYVKVSLN